MKRVVLFFAFLWLGIIGVSAQVDRCDVNGDGEISVSDIMGIVNYVLGVEQNVFILENADVNGDGDISVADVLGLVNKYLE